MKNEENNKIATIGVVGIILIVFLSVGFFMGRKVAPACVNSNHTDLKDKISSIKDENNKLSNYINAEKGEEAQKEDKEENKAKDKKTNKKINSYNGYPGGYFKLKNGIFESSFKQSEYLDTGVIMTDMFPGASIVTYEVTPDNKGLISIYYEDEMINYEIYAECNPEEERYFINAARYKDSFSDKPEEVRNILNMITEVSRY